MDKIDIIKKYSEFCAKTHISFSNDENISSYDDSTLFCPAGMQQFKSSFKDQNIVKTIANVQSCLRLLDIGSIGDGSHFLYFNMLGFFSFRSWSVKDTIDFWMIFLGELGITPDYTTVHPDKYEEWKDFHIIPVRLDEGCTWSDGELSGYCTEFYIDNDQYKDLEIGNIVNICGDCIDVGFGAERLDMVVNNISPLSDVDTLKLTINKLIDCGYKPSNKMHGYVLRKLITQLIRKNESIDSIYFEEEKLRQEVINKKYLRLKDKYKAKSKEWWLDTHGVDLDLMNDL